MIIDMRISLIEAEGETQGVQNLDFKTTLATGLDDAAG